MSAVVGGFLVKKSRKERRSFITGSLKYGDNYRQEPSSDVDLVIYIDSEDQKALEGYTTSPVEAPRDLYELNVTSSRIRVDGFDLILVSDKADYDHWKMITDRLVDDKPLTRADAVAAFKADEPQALPGAGQKVTY